MPRLNLQVAKSHNTRLHIRRLLLVHSFLRSYPLASLMNIWLVSFTLALVLLLHKLETRKPHSSGLLVIPSLPIIGNTLQVLNNPSKTFSRWTKAFNSSLFVIYLGRTPVVVANSRSSILRLWKEHPLSTNSRPTLHTFHTIVSRDQGPTIGSTPYGPSYRQMRKNISKYLCPQSLSQARELAILDDASSYILELLVAECLIDNKDRNLLRMIQGFVLRCAVHLTYGFELDTESQDKTLTDLIIKTENKIVNFRSITSNYQDYLPFFRLPVFDYVLGSDAKNAKTLRDGYMELLHSLYEQKHFSNSNTSATPFLTRMKHGHPSAQLNASEIKSFCLTMVSAGLDNLALTFNHILGQLSQPGTGAAIQEKLLFELMKLNNHSFQAAWKSVAKNFECSYALALIHEGLRSFTVLPLGLARATSKPISIGDICIPQDSILLMNAFEANHDQDVFKNPYSFTPERWLDSNGLLLKGDAMNHLSFGLGSRKCAGDHLSIKEMYILLCRFILLFQVGPPSNCKWLMELDSFASNSAPKAASFEPREFKYSLRVRQKEADIKTCFQQFNLNSMGQRNQPCSQPPI